MRVPKIAWGRGEIAAKNRGEREGESFGEGDEPAHQTCPGRRPPLASRKDFLLASHTDETYTPKCIQTGQKAAV